MIPPDSHQTAQRSSVSTRRQFLGTVGATTAIALAGCSGGEPEEVTDADSIRDVTDTDIHDWETLAQEEEATPTELPSGAPSGGFGFSKAERLTLFYASENGASESIDVHDDVYVIVLDGGDVQQVLEWETPIEPRDELSLGEEVLRTDLSSIQTVVFVWDHWTGAYVVKN